VPPLSYYTNIVFTSHGYNGYCFLFSVLPVAGLTIRERQTLRRSIREAKKKGALFASPYS